MSAAKVGPDTGAKLDYRIHPGGPWSGAWKVAAVLAVLGLVGVIAGWTSDAHRFAYSYLFAFVTFVTLGLGAIFFVLIHYLTAANWSTTSRRTAEFFAVAMPVFALLFVPVYLTRDHLFPWLQSHHVAESAEHGAAQGSGHGEHVAPLPSHAEGAHGSPEQAHAGTGADEEGEGEHAAILASKRPYLNLGFFTVRALIYFAVWSWLGLRFFRLSTRQDSDGDVAHTRAAQRFAPGATALFGITLTFAAFDWIMSLNPMWYSTIYGVTIFAGSAVSIYALLTVVTMSFRDRGLIGEAVNVEHYHDFGKLLFGFTVFWAYVSFSQFFLIWYSSIPEETIFYHQRWGNGPWIYVSLALVFGHFVLPFAFLLSRNIKRRLPLLRGAAIWMLAAHVLEMYWQVLPNYGRHHPDPARRIAEDANSILAPHWMDVACLLFVGGAYLAVVFHVMTRHPLIPVRDPRLDRSLRFENF